MATSDVANLISSGSFFDPTLVPRVANANTEVAAAQVSLISAGLTTLAASLDGFDPDVEMVALSAYLANTISETMDRISMFNSIASATGADPTTLLPTAFGSALTARAFVTAIDDINTTANTISTASTDSSLDGEVATVDDITENLTARVMQIADMPASIPDIISNETNFYTNAPGTLASYTQAQQVMNMYGDYNTKAILGAVGSDQLMAALSS